MKIVRWLEALAAVTGFGLIVGGIAHWSVPGACVLAGVLLLASVTNYRRDTRS